MEVQGCPLALKCGSQVVWRELDPAICLLSLPQHRRHVSGECISDLRLPTHTRREVCATSLVDWKMAASLGRTSPGVLYFVRRDEPRVIDDTHGARLRQNSRVYWRHRDHRAVVVHSRTRAFERDGVGVRHEPQRRLSKHMHLLHGRFGHG